MKKAWLLLIILLLASLGAQSLFDVHVPVDVQAGVEITPYFYTWFGFGCGVLIILVAKILGLFLKRRDDYYKEAKYDK